MKNCLKGERWLATMLTRNEKFILSAWSYISSQQENTNSHGMYPSNKILKILEFEISQTKEGFPQTHRIENCTLCNVEEISKL